jgi:O-antigen/teichoic acid export membrane protein
VTDAPTGVRTGRAPGAKPEVAPSGRRPLPGLGMVAAMWRRHHDLLVNAGSLLATTGVTSVLGFAFWTFAARQFSPRDVGYGSAAVSAMSLLGTIGMFGMGTVLIGELPRRKHRGGLVMAALLACGLGSLALGAGFAILAPKVSPRFADLLGTPVESAVFAVGVVLTAVVAVFDEATIGLLRGGVQLSRNLVFAVAKMAALPVGAFVLHDQFGVGITMSWIAGMAISLAGSAIWLRARGTRVLPGPDWAVLRGLGKTVFAHNWLNMAIVVPVTLLPLLVTMVVSPEANAAFYVAWMLTSFLGAVPWHLSTVLFAVAAADPSQVPRKLRFSLKMSLYAGIPGMLVLGLGARYILAIFGPSYAQTATFPLLLLTLSYIPSLPRNFYIAVARAKGYVSRAAVVLTTSAVLQLSTATLAGQLDGLKGVSIAILATNIVVALFTTPAILREAGLYGRYRREFAAAEQGRRLRLEERPAACTALRCNCRTIRDCPVLAYSPEVQRQMARAAEIDALARLEAASPTEAFPMLRPESAPTEQFPRIRPEVAPRTIPFPVIHAGFAPTMPFPIVTPAMAERVEQDRLVAGGDRGRRTPDGDWDHWAPDGDRDRDPGGHRGPGGDHARTSPAPDQPHRRRNTGRGSHRRRH